jgi:NhaA family Na+:H+ antiporter
MPMSQRMVRVRAVGRYLSPRGDEFVSVEALGGAVLIAAAVGALVWANVSPGTYGDVWGEVVTFGAGRLETSLDVRHWVNDGFMTLFFFVVGLEIKRELVSGELRDPRAAAVPVLAAFGGMVVPALIFTAFNAGTYASRGWGVPIATDIALAVGVLALLGSSVPSPLRLFLLTLAIVDDIGAIVVIALFYSEGVAFEWLGGAVAVVAVVVGLRRFGLASPLAYVLPALALWFCVHESGVHATITGVVLGLLTPALPVRGRPVLTDLERRLHGVSSFGVVPLFALANAGVVLSGDAFSDAASSRLAWGIAAGLLVGKTLGITGASALACRLRLGRLPDDLRLAHVAGAGMLAGIGFTVSLFVANLSFEGALLDQAKVAVLGASVVAGLVGAIVVRAVARTVAAPVEEPA